MTIGNLFYNKKDIFSRKTQDTWSSFLTFSQSNYSESDNTIKILCFAENAHNHFHIIFKKIFILQIVKQHAHLSHFSKTRMQSI